MAEKTARNPRGAGRKGGIPNGKPIKALEVQSELLQKFEPHLDLIVKTAVEILTDPNAKNNDKVLLMKTLFGFFTSAAAQATVDNTVEALGKATVSDLLALRNKDNDGTE